MRYSTQVSRRSFLALAGALPLATRAAFAASKIPVGLELYSVRDFLAKDLTGTVRAVAKLGYEVVEFYSPYLAVDAAAGHGRPQAARRSRRQVPVDAQRRTRRSRPTACRRPSTSIRPSAARPSSWPAAGQVRTLDGWKAVADQLNAAAEQAAAARDGGRVPQPSDSSGSPIGGPASDGRPRVADTPKDVVLQFDVGTCVEAGADPVAWIKAQSRAASRACTARTGRPAARATRSLFGEGDAPVEADHRGGRVRRRRRVLPDRAGSGAGRRAAQARRAVPGKLETTPRLTFTGDQKVRRKSLQEIKRSGASLLVSFPPVQEAKRSGEKTLLTS